MSAIFSECGRYRYRLDRQLSLFGHPVAFLLHNPSIANGTKDDPTTRRVINFATAWGASRLIIVNPWARVATSPKKLWLEDDPIGPENEEHLREVFCEVALERGILVAAWGVIKAPRTKLAAARMHLDKVVQQAVGFGCRLHAIGANMDGSPKHPLYVPNGATLTPWSFL